MCYSSVYLNTEEYYGRLGPRGFLRGYREVQLLARFNSHGVALGYAFV